MENNNNEVIKPDETINDRLQIILDTFYNGDVRYLARDSNIPLSSLNSIFGDRKSKPNSDTLEKMYLNALQQYDIDAGWLAMGVGDMYNRRKSTNSSKNIEKSIPYYGDLSVSAGEKGLAEINIAEQPTGYLSLPNVSAEYLFPVVGCSMLPIIKAGDVIGVNRIHRWERLDPDKIYMIITKEERMIKRLRVNSENPRQLWCISENYKEFLILKDDVIAIFHVVWHGGLL